MEKRTAHISDKVTSCGEAFPLHLHYAGQYKPQYCAVTLDLRTGEVGYHVSGDYGSGVPADIFHGARRAYTVTPYLSAERLELLIEKHLRDFQAILDDSTTSYDFRSNLVGNLGPRAEAIENAWHYRGIDEDVRDIAAEEFDAAQAEAEA